MSDRTQTIRASVSDVRFTLILTMVLVVGVFDFGNAFNLKQKITNAARAAARFGSYSPTNDLNAAAPPSVAAIGYLVDDNLTAAGLNDCGLAAIVRAGGASSGPLQWTFTASGNGCPAPGMTLIVDRSYAVATAVGVQAISTQVQISYPYKWTFGSVIGLLVPSATYTLPVQISGKALAPNLD